MHKNKRIIENGVAITPHEHKVVKLLRELGYLVEPIPPSNTKWNPNPDFIIDGLIWELKSPVTKKKQTIKRIVKEASRQSENLIVDLRFAKIDENIAFRILEHEFNSSRRIKRLVIIRKSGLLKYKK